MRISFLLSFVFILLRKNRGYLITHTYSNFREKPNDVEWNQLNQKKMPILLNYAQCKLNLKEYYEVIEHCSSVLQYEPSILNINFWISLKDIFLNSLYKTKTYNYKKNCCS